MRTQLMIMLVVLAVLLFSFAVVAVLVGWLGWFGGLGAALALGVAVGLAYVRMIKPWHMRWGATDAEVSGPLPGDDLIPGAGQATRAIEIHARPQQIWPWLVQLGYGKAGWYSYDWIDNDFRPSARQIMPEHQVLEVGDKILMMPAMGFEVRSIDEPRSIVSVLEDGSTSWCLALVAAEDGSTRLLSRWRPKLQKTPSTFFMTALAEPGTFIMEQKMLRSIRDRVEAAETVVGGV